MSWEEEESRENFLKIYGRKCKSTNNKGKYFRTLYFMISVKPTEETLE